MRRQEAGGSRVGRLRVLFNGMTGFHMKNPGMRDRAMHVRKFSTARSIVWMVVAGIVAVGPILAGPAQAQDHRRAGPGWHDRDILRFHEHDLDHWRGGRWFHGPHGGRDGWWWIVGGVWYFYPAPVYPYPDPYLPPVVVAPAPVPAGPPMRYYYYCPSPPGYYPYVAGCRVPWRAVAPLPPPLPGNPPPPGALPAPPTTPPPG